MVVEGLSRINDIWGDWLVYVEMMEVLVVVTRDDKHHVLKSRMSRS